MRDIFHAEPRREDGDQIIQFNGASKRIEQRLDNRFPIGEVELVKILVRPGERRKDGWIGQCSRNFFRARFVFGAVAPTRKPADELAIDFPFGIGDLRTEETAQAVLHEGAERETSAKIFGAGISRGLAGVKIQVLDVATRGTTLEFLEEAELDIAEKFECILILRATVFRAERDVELTAQNAAGCVGDAREFRRKSFGGTIRKHW
jgi:hypothetical protein